MNPLRPSLRIVIVPILLTIIVGLMVSLKATFGVGTFLTLTAILVLSILCCREAHLFIGRLCHRNLKLLFYWNIVIACCSTMLVFTGFEWYLHLHHQERAAENSDPLIMPDEWKIRDVVVDGAKSACYWHGKLHVYDEVGMRRTTPFPPKQAGYCRIMVVGDSLTYGKGVDVNETYPHRIETALSSEYRVDVLNLGVCGVQSEEILHIIFKYAPQLHPDIILYGVCQNDFLETGEGQQTREQRETWRFPLPERFKLFMIRHTLSGEFFEQRYDKLLMKFGLRADFYANILRNLYGYQIRFTRDVTVMNLYAIQNGLPPIMAMVLDQYPEVNGQGHNVTRRAEFIMKLAGMDVISTENYYVAYNGWEMGVSQWEGHPNEEAHRIFAEYFVNALKAHPILQQYKK